MKIGSIGYTAVVVNVGQGTYMLKFVVSTHHRAVDHLWPVGRFVRGSKYAGTTMEGRSLGPFRFEEGVGNEFWIYHARRK